MSAHLCLFTVGSVVPWHEGQRDLVFHLRRESFYCLMLCILAQLAQCFLEFSCLHLPAWWRTTGMKGVCYQVWLHVSSGHSTQVLMLVWPSLQPFPHLFVQTNFIFILSKLTWRTQGCIRLNGSDTQYEEEREVLVEILVQMWQTSYQRAI